MDDLRADRARFATVPVASLLQRHPAAASVFFAHRMACVGCSLSGFDTVADAAREYHVPLAPFLDELERAAALAPANDFQPNRTEPDRSPR